MSVLPASADTGAGPDVARPPVAPPEPWSFPEPARTVLDNGLTLLAYDVPGQYVVIVRLGVPMPLSAEPRDREGVATILSRTLDEGTLRHSAEEFAELLERKGIAFGAGMSEAGLVVDVDMPKRHLPDALDLLSQAVREAAFPVEEVTRHIKTRLAEIEQERANAGQRASWEFATTYFDPAERASRPAGGTRDAVAAISREDVAEFHAERVAPGGSTLVVAGDLDGLDVPMLVRDALGGWDTPAPRADEPAPAARASDASRIVVVDRPGSVQTELYVGCPGPDRHVEGGFAAYPVLGFVLGGSPNARIDAVLREERGFTYGMRSAFRPRRRGGVFLTTGSVRADATVEALGLLLDILDRAREGFDEDETRSGVDFLFRTAPGRYATADAVADEAVTLALDDLTTRFTTDNLQAIRTLDAARLSEAYARFATGEWTVVVVGDASRYAEGIRALGRGGVSVVPN